MMSQVSSHTTRLRTQNQGDGPVVDDLHDHVSAEDADAHRDPFRGDGVSHVFDQRSGLLWWSGLDKRGAPSFANVTEQRELTDEQYLSPHFGHRPVHQPAVVGKHPETCNLRTEDPGVVPGVGVGHPNQNEQPRADFTHHRPLDRHRGPDHPLHDADHVFSLISSI